MGRLSGKTALITGAARGIGAAIAQAFKAKGAHVIVTDIDETDGSALAKTLDCPFFKLDVANEADWDSVAGHVQSLDILVNNAGIIGLEDKHARHDPEYASLESWRAVHRVNLDGTFLGCRFAIRVMKKKGEGSIINMSSRSGMVGIPAAAAYASSKAGIRNHTKSVALYCAGQGWNIRCNSIHPAAILTPMWDPMLGEGAKRKKAMAEITAGIPLRRFGRPEEVAALAVFLASDDAQYMTGEELTIDGGILAGSAASPVSD